MDENPEYSFTPSLPRLLLTPSAKRKRRDEIIEELLQQQQEGKDRVESFHQAVSIIDQRLLDSWILEQLANASQVIKDSVDQFEEVVGEVQTIIEKNTPCQAKKSFPTGENGEEEEVQCELTKQEHETTHKSKRTYKPIIELTMFESEVLGWTVQHDKACWWRGDFVDPNIKLNKETFSPGIKQFLENPYDPSWPEDQINTFQGEFQRFRLDNITRQFELMSSIYLRRGCISCFSDCKEREMKLCGHYLCTNCFQSIKKSCCLYCDPIFK